MFRDTSESIKEEVEKALETYSVEEILEHNDLTLEEVLELLVREGFILLPEVKSL